MGQMSRKYVFPRLTDKLLTLDLLIIVSTFELVLKLFGTYFCNSGSSRVQCKYEIGFFFFSSSFRFISSHPHSLFSSKKSVITEEGLLLDLCRTDQ